MPPKRGRKPGRRPRDIAHAGPVAAETARRDAVRTAGMGSTRATIESTSALIAAGDALREKLCPEDAIDKYAK